MSCSIYCRSSEGTSVELWGSTAFAQIVWGRRPAGPTVGFFANNGVLNSILNVRRKRHTIHHTPVSPLLPLAWRKYIHIVVQPRSSQRMVSQLSGSPEVLGVSAAMPLLNVLQPTGASSPGEVYLGVDESGVEQNDVRNHELGSPCWRGGGGWRGGRGVRCSSTLHLFLCRFVFYVFFVIFFFFFVHFLYSMECVYRAWRIQYDAMGLHFALWSLHT